MRPAECEEPGIEVPSLHSVLFRLMPTCLRTHLFGSDVRECITGVKIRQTALNTISIRHAPILSHRASRRCQSASDGGQCPSPTLVPVQIRAKTTPCSLPCSPKKLHRKSRGATVPQPGARAQSNPFHFGIPKQTTTPAFTPSKPELAVVDAPGSNPE